MTSAAISSGESSIASTAIIIRQYVIPLLSANWPPGQDKLLVALTDIVVM